MVPGQLAANGLGGALELCGRKSDWLEECSGKWEGRGQGAGRGVGCLPAPAISLAWLGVLEPGRLYPLPFAHTG